MKKLPIVGVIIGCILLASTIVATAKFLYAPTSVPLINLAIGFTQLFLIALAGFFIAFSLRIKNKQDLEGISIPEQGSQEERNTLIRRRNWILGFYILQSIVGSVQFWILNDYSAGLTLINLSIILDVICNAALAYVAFEFFVGRRDVSKLLFYIVLFYTAEQIALFALRGHWFGAVICFVIGIYFIFSLKAAVTKQNFRIAHFVLLPISFMLIAALPYFDNGNIKQLDKEAMLLNQQFSEQSGKLQGNYLIFLQREDVDQTLTDVIRKDVLRRGETINLIEKNLGMYKAEFESQLQDVQVKEKIENLRYVGMQFELHRQQSAKILELMDYADDAAVDGLNISEKKRIRELKEELEGFGPQITKLQFDLDQANLVY